MTSLQQSSLREKVRRFRSSTPFIVWTVSYAIFLDGVLFTVVLPILPYELSVRSGIAQDKVLHWNTILLTVFGVSCVAVSPIIGWWTDQNTSRRLPFLSALLMLLTGTLLIWLTKPIAVAVVSRVLQGISATTIYVTGFAIVVDTVDAKHIAEYMGHIAIAINVGNFAGPLLGGIVYGKAGWNAVWAMMLGLICLDIVLRLVMLEKERPTPSGREQSSGESCGISKGSTEKAQIAVHVQEVMSEDIERQSPANMPDPWKHRDSEATLVENRHSGKTTNSIEVELAADGKPHRPTKLPAILTLLCSMRMDVALLGICVQGAIFSGLEAVLTLHIEEIWHYNAMQSGLFFLPLTVPAFFAPLIGRLVDKIGPRWVISGGFTLLCPVLVVIRFVDHHTDSQKALLAALLALIGFGVMVTLDSLMAEISYVVRELEIQRPDLYRQGAGAYGQAYSLFNLAWSVGYVVGPLIAGLITDRYGWGTMGWVLGMISGFTSILCALGSGGFVSKI